LTRIAIIGSGNIGSDLLYKVRRNPELELVAMVGIDPASEGLARARSMGIWTTAKGLDDYLANGPEADVAVDATSADAHKAHAPVLKDHGLRCIDLTPSALGPAVVPDVNLDEYVGAPEVNLVTCGAQATVPIVHGLASLGGVEYAEIVSTVASKSAGPGTRRNIDEFTVATARSLEKLGGAKKGKAIMVLNPAEPPIVMRNTIYIEAPGIPAKDAVSAVRSTAGRIASYVPGYRLGTDTVVSKEGLITVFIEVSGAGDYLPEYAGNLDIMTSAAVRVAELYGAKASPPPLAGEGSVEASPPARAAEGNVGASPPPRAGEGRVGARR
jgi:acetaldehyde dehydrogenase